VSLVERYAAPMLVCLNLQLAYLDSGDRRVAPGALSALAHAQACLSWARGQDIRIVHVHSAHASREDAAPIPGFEPKPSEPLVRKCSDSLFDSAELTRMRPPLQHGLVLGFTGVRDCLAAAVDARRSGSKLIFITDAIASPGLPTDRNDSVDGAVNAVLGAWAPLITTAELLGRDTRLRGLGGPI